MSERAASRQEKTGYWHAYEVLPFELVQEANRHLKVSTKITFAASHRSYNRSESLLPEKLVDKCREALDNKSIMTRRIILFGANRSHGGSATHAFALLELGFSPKVIADALGYHIITLKRWGVHDAHKSKIRKAVVIDDAKESAYKDAGFTQVQKVRPGDESKPSHYIQVGAALEALESKKFNQLLKEITEKERKAKGRKREL